eukprot:c3545_g2_i1 orf=135-704(+)
MQANKDYPSTAFPETIKPRTSELQYFKHEWKGTKTASHAISPQRAEAVHGGIHCVTDTGTCEQIKFDNLPTKHTLPLKERKYSQSISGEDDGKSCDETDTISKISIDSKSLLDHGSLRMRIGADFDIFSQIRSKLQDLAAKTLGLKVEDLLVDPAETVGKLLRKLDICNFSSVIGTESEHSSKFSRVLF